MLGNKKKGYQGHITFVDTYILIIYNYIFT